MIRALAIAAVLATASASPASAQVSGGVTFSFRSGGYNAYPYDEQDYGSDDQDYTRSYVDPRVWYGYDDQLDDATLAYDRHEEIERWQRDQELRQYRQHQREERDRRHYREDDD